MDYEVATMLGVLESVVGDIFSFLDSVLDDFSFPLPRVDAVNAVAAKLRIQQSRNFHAAEVKMLTGEIR